MKRNPFHSVTFTEHPVTDTRLKHPGIFDVVSVKQQRASDFIENGHFSMHLYCSSLLARISTLTLKEVRPFLIFQVSQLKQPLEWLNNVEELLVFNVRHFDSPELVYKFEKTKILLQLLIQDFENNKGVKQKVFDFDEVKITLANMAQSDEQLTYLFRCRADYLQNRPAYTDPAEIPFDEKISIEIKKIRELDASLKELKNRPAGKIQFSDPLIDNEEFIIMMKLSKRTAQNWRDSGIIGFTQIGNKIYYKLSDVDNLIKANYVKPRRVI